MALASLSLLAPFSSTIELLEELLELSLGFSVVFELVELSVELLAGVSTLASVEALLSEASADELPLLELAPGSLV